MHGYDEGIKLGFTDVKVLGTILVNVYGITLRLDVVQSSVSYMDPLMVLMMSSFSVYFLETHWDVLMVK